MAKASGAPPAYGRPGDDRLQEGKELNIRPRSLSRHQLTIRHLTFERMQIFSLYQSVI